MGFAMYMACDKTDLEHGKIHKRSDTEYHVSNYVAVRNSSQIL